MWSCQFEKFYSNRIVELPQQMPTASAQLNDLQLVTH